MACDLGFILFWKANWEFNLIVVGSSSYLSSILYLEELWRKKRQVLLKLNGIKKYICTFSMLLQVVFVELEPPTFTYIHTYIHLLFVTTSRTKLYNISLVGASVVTATSSWCDFIHRIFYMTEFSQLVHAKVIWQVKKILITFVHTEWMLIFFRYYITRWNDISLHHLLAE